MMKTILEIKNLSKSFAQGSEKVEVIKNANLQISETEVASLVGESGSGKSTLLHLAASLINADSGIINIDGMNLSRLDESEKTSLRRTKIGFVYQESNLLSDFTSLENVMLPLLISNISKKDAESEAKAILAKVNLSNRVNHYPNQLSGGEKQRVAIARAFIHKPKLILADEPTGNLDKKNAQNIIDLFLSLSKENKTAILLVTHDENIANSCSKNFKLKNGAING